MADDKQDTPVSRAIRRRKELQDAIRESMKELEKIDEFLRMWRHLSADAEQEIKGTEVSGGHLILGRAGHGQTQPTFEHMVRAMLQDVGRPMQSSEIVEEFAKRGQPIAGNATRTAWNRLWQAAKNGALVNVPKYGYWLADEPVPPAVLAAPPPKRGKGIPGKTTRRSWTGKPHGRQRALSDAEVARAERLIMDGMSFAQAAEEVGVTKMTLHNYFRGGRKAIMAKKMLQDSGLLPKKDESA